MSVSSWVGGGRGKVPVILQSEMAECGLACLAMIAHFHGREVDLGTLRQRFPLTLRGASLKRLMEIARRLDLGGRGLRLEVEFLQNLQLPAILHWNFNHFVVLESATREKVTIHDPERGRRVLALDEVSRQFTGVALELTPTADFETRREAVTLGLGDLWTTSRGLAGSVVQILVLAFTLQVFGLLSPYYMQLVVDEVVVGRDSDLLLMLGLAFLALQVVAALTRALRSWVIVYVGTHLNVNLVSNLFRHLMELPMEYFARRHVGDIVSRFASLDEVRDILPCLTLFHCG